MVTAVTKFPALRNTDLHYLIKSIRTPTRNCIPTFPVTHFPVVDINIGWAHPLPLWQVELYRGDFRTKCLNISGGMVAHSSGRAVARAVSVVERWGLERSWRSNSFHRCSMRFRSGLWAGQSISGTVPSQTLTYGWQHCHADTDNCHHRTGLLPQTVGNGSKCPCILLHLDFHAVLREGQVHSMKNTLTR
jgi:hypothetical protein